MAGYIAINQASAEEVARCSSIEHLCAYLMLVFLFYSNLLFFSKFQKKADKPKYQFHREDNFHFLAS